MATNIIETLYIRYRYILGKNRCRGSERN